MQRFWHPWFHFTAGTNTRAASSANQNILRQCNDDAVGWGSVEIQSWSAGRRRSIKAQIPKATEVAGKSQNFSFINTNRKRVFVLFCLLRSDCSRKWRWWCSEIMDRYNQSILAFFSGPHFDLWQDIPSVQSKIYLGEVTFSSPLLPWLTTGHSKPQSFWLSRFWRRLLSSIYSISNKTQIKENTNINKVQVFFIHQCNLTFDLILLTCGQIGKERW